MECKSTTNGPLNAGLFVFDVVEVLDLAGLYEVFSRTRPRTSHWGALDLLKSLDVTIDVVSDKRVVDSGIITSAGVSAGIDSAFYVVDKLCGNDVAIDTARYRGYVAKKPDRLASHSG